MPIVTGIRRVPAAADKYEVTIDWGNETKTYGLRVFEDHGIRGYADSDALDFESRRCPPLSKHIVRLVFEVHDGRPPTFPVPIALLSTTDSA